MEPSKPTLSYGSWPSPITLDQVVAAGKSAFSPWLDGDDLHLLEGRPEDAGRVTIIRRGPDGTFRDAIPGGHQAGFREGHPDGCFRGGRSDDNPGAALGQGNSDSYANKMRSRTVEGKLNRMEDELSMSYPTIRSRLHEIIRLLGYEPGKEEAAPVPPPAPVIDRKQVLTDLESGLLTFEEAMQKLKGGN